MKKFEDLCKMTQKQLKEYMKQYLTENNYEVVCDDGFLYAKGTVPVLLVAHLDTVHKVLCKEITRINNKISSPQGIGGDDRCGVFMIANIVKDLHCSVLLCEDEEVGAIGAAKFTKTEYINNLDVNYMIEFDRKGNSDAVFYSCDNTEFINFVTNCTGYKKAYGTFTDISKLMPASKICGVNLSCGYYNAHLVSEYVLYDEMMNTISVAKTLIEEKCDGPFKYVERQYSFYHNFGKQPTKKKQSIVDLIKKDYYLELDATVKTENGYEYSVSGSGETKAECWFDLFCNYPHVCMNDIVDYDFT